MTFSRSVLWFFAEGGQAFSSPGRPKQKAEASRHDDGALRPEA